MRGQCVPFTTSYFSLCIVPLLRSSNFWKISKTGVRFLDIIRTKLHQNLFPVVGAVLQTPLGSLGLGPVTVLP